jgi:hypothetical protein
MSESGKTALNRRRRMLQATVALLAGGPLALRAQQARVPLADVHSHYGMISRRGTDSGMAADMRDNGVALVAWKLVADARWIRTTATGIEQARQPAPGELAAYFSENFERMRTYVAAQKLRTVLASADVDAQTTEPVHNGLSAMGMQLVEACNAQGVLVDLAHSTGASVDQALEIAKAPLLWSHGWVEGEGGSWQDRTGFFKRRLSVAHAKKIAGRGGVVGLWGFGRSRPGSGWSVGPRDTRSYAKEVAGLVDKIGADHVAFGTDIEGVGPNWAINDYSHLRSVVDHLQEMKLPGSVIERIAYANYARILKATLK